MIYYIVHIQIDDFKLARDLLITAKQELIVFIAEINLYRSLKKANLTKE